MTQVVDAGNGFLAFVAALGQVDRGSEQVELVRNGFIVCLGANARTPCCYAKGFGGEGAGKGRSATTFSSSAAGTRYSNQGRSRPGWFSSDTVA